MKKILCVFWHRIYSDSSSTVDAGGNPSVSTFRNQLSFLIQNYTPISICEFLEIIEGREDGRSYRRPPVLLGFDDGFKSVLTNGLPIMTELKVPATMFVIAGTLLDRQFVPWFLEVRHIIRKTRRQRLTLYNANLDLRVRGDRLMVGRLFRARLRACRLETERQQLLTEFAALMDVRRPTLADLDEDLLLVDREDLAALERSSVLTIASHTMTHRYLESLTGDEQLYELRESNSVLRQNCAAYCPVIAYPSGSFNRVTMSAVDKIYRAGFAVASGSSYRNHHAYPRIALESTAANELAYLLGRVRLNWLLPIKRVLNVIGLRRDE